MTPFRVHSITTDGISSYLFNTKSLLYLFIQTAYCVSSTSQCAVTWTSLNSLVTYIFVTLFLSLRWTVAILQRMTVVFSSLLFFFLHFLSLFSIMAQTVQSFLFVQFRVFMCNFYFFLLFVFVFSSAHRIVYVCMSTTVCLYARTKPYM